MKNPYLLSLFVALACLYGAPSAHAALTLTSGNNATTTPNVATSITGFQIVGNAASTTPVKIHVTNGTVSVPVVSGVTMSGNNTATLNLSGTVANLNTALSSLTYTRGSTGTDTLEVALVNSDQIYFADNGHVYQYVAGTISWNAAKPAAEALTAYGATGYLVTITSSAENNFVKARLSGDAWIGASDSGTEGTWKWVTGPEAGTTFWQGTSGGSTVGGNYASWSGGEPNQSGDEDCGETYVANGTWNDLPCTATVSGYVAEFGSDSSPATVVSKNVSIVTADVPAVTSIFPATGALTATTTANLVIGFSKTVTADTGDILIKKTADNSIVETIPVGSAQVTGGGTSAIMINPASTLAEGVQYYVIIPSTAFKDGSNNRFDGISSASTWTFTTLDQTAPIISAIATTSIATTTASIDWTTNEGASTKVVYSAGASYGSSTSETDTGTRVTSHTKTLTGLAGCTTYNFKVVSADAAGNYATSTSALFTTLGCAGNAAPLSATTTPVSVSTAATSTLSESGRTLTVETPANFTNASTSVVIQIRGMTAEPVIGAIGKPDAALSNAAAVVFNVTAVIDNTTTVDSFDVPVTITYAYTDEDIAGLDERSLSMYHYASGSWSELDACTVDAGANTITCTAPHFSVFAIFGSPASTQTSGGSKGTVQSRVKSLISMGQLAKAEEIKSGWPQIFPASSGAAVTAAAGGDMSVRDLEVGMTGEDVRALQKLLNAGGYAVAAAGVGSPGNETEYFGALTKAALARYQAANGIAPAAGYFGPRTRTHMSAWAVAGLWW